MNAGLHEGLLALIAAAVTASVFTIGFASARHHDALREMRRAARDGEPFGARLIEDEATHLIAWGNAVLWVLVVGAALVAGFTSDSIGAEEVLTLAGLAVVETIVVVLGWLDRQHVQSRAEIAQREANDVAAKARERAANRHNQATGEGGRRGAEARAEATAREIPAKPSAPDSAGSQAAPRAEGR